MTTNDPKTELGSKKTPSTNQPESLTIENLRKLERRVAELERRLNERDFKERVTADRHAVGK